MLNLNTLLKSKIIFHLLTSSREKTFLNVQLKKWGFPGGSVVKNLFAKQETRVQSLGQEDPLERETAAHSKILAWEIP